MLLVKISNTLVKIFSGIPKEQGFSTFWRGNLINIFMIIPKSMVQFGLYENVKKYIVPSSSTPEVY